MHTLLEQIDRGQLWTFPGGIHPPQRKEISNQAAIATLPLPPQLRVPVRQHIGAPGRVLVRVGEQVLKGQPLTEADSPMAVPVHAPTSGTITAIAPMAVAHPSGLSELCIELESDGKDQWRPQQPISNPSELSPKALRQIIAAAGIAGMGGATFPSAVKLATQDKIKFLLINGAECEPYISADDRLMREQAPQILQGIALLCQIINPERVLIGIEDNKPEAIRAMEQALAQAKMPQVLVRTIPTKYPSGSEKQLIEILTGQQVPKGKLPADLGVLMHNVGTCFAIKRAICNDEPLIERVVTVTGEQAQQAGNYWVRIGTPVAWLLQHTHTNALTQQPLILGGPMMGFALPDSSAAISKGANCVIAPSLNELPPQPQPRNCIRCGECAQACPQQLLPQQLYWHAQAGEHDKAEQLNLFDCIECGACAFVCPSDIPLVQHYRIAKSAVREEKAAAAKAAAAKIRFEARQARLDKEKQERENRHKKAASSKAASGAANSAGVAAAIAKLKAEKAAQAASAEHNDSGEVDMAELRRQRKAQARAAKAAQAEHSESNPSSDEADPRKAAAAAVARAKAKRAAAQQAGTETEAAAKPKSAAVAAAIAKAKAKQATEAGVVTDTAAPQAAKPKSPAVAAAIAKAKAKQAAEAGMATDTAAPQAAKPKSAAVAAAIAKAKAKQAAERANSAGTDADTATGTDTAAAAATPVAAKPKSAAIAKAKAKQAAEAGVATDTAAPQAAKPKSAAVAAAIAKAKAKQAAERANSAGTDADTATGTDTAAAAATPVAAKPKSAAVAAAIAKAKAKQAAERAQQIDDDSGAQAEATVVADDGATEPTTVSSAKPADKRKAAVAAAIAKAKAKKAAEQANKENN
ncbi:electron transport complex subunit RsxC [uncultured Ferrimonas sp.]|uniref:electron transport complex subunit RsxC n=1 Tax=uncultured Ferrimonas sp. TaxID=432640 RepID=UPI00261D6F76|nr:electron transport complex subunit RsxC [uncultured Ferrimonas sp.]